MSEESDASSKVMFKGAFERVNKVIAFFVKLIAIDANHKAKQNEIMC